MADYGDGPRWWEERGDALADALCREARRINELTIDRQQLIINSYALYGSFGAWGIGSGLSLTLPSSQRLSHNALANATDSLVAEWAQSLARPEFVTNGGTWDEQERAEQLTSWCEAQFDACEVDDLAPQLLRDGAVAGLGILSPYLDGDRMRVERIFPCHLLVDDRSAIDTLPRTFIVRRFLDKWTLTGRFPSRKAEIMKAHLQRGDQHWIIDAGGNPHQSDDVVRVYEAWRLPSRHGAKDGLHAIVLDDAVLFQERWERDRPPMAFFRPLPSARGFWGDSLVQRAAPIQLELNKLLRRIQDSMHHHARMIILVHEKSGIPAGKFNNDVYNIIRYSGTGPPPQPFIPNSMPADVYGQVRQYVSDIYDVMGVSELSAKSQIPRGMANASGVALDTYNETESRRFITSKRNADKCRVDLAREMVYAQRALAEENENAEVVYEEDGIPVRIPWRQIDLDEQVMRVRCFPSGALKNSPAGRMNDIMRWVDAGVVQPRDGLRMANIPDAKALMDMELAPEKLIEECFKQLRRGEDYSRWMPLPYMDLELGIKKCVAYLSQLQARGAPEETLEIFRRWYTDASDLAGLAAPPPPPPGALEPPMNLPGMPPGGLLPPGVPPPGGPPLPGGMPPLPPPGGPGPMMPPPGLPGMPAAA